MEVVLLGTAGGPGGHPQRAGISTLLQDAGKTVLVDAGEGVVHRWTQAGAPASGPDLILLTHLHDDHTAGLPALLSFAFTTRGRPLHIIGPQGTRALVDGALAFAATNAAIRNAESGAVRDPRDFVQVEERTPGLWWEGDGLRIVAVGNSHFSRGILATDEGSSVSLQVAAGDCRVVLTGDTGPSEAVEALAAGADLLVSEMASGADVAAVPAFVRSHMLREHLSPAAVGQLAQRARVRRVVLSHIRDVTDEDVAGVRLHYAGPVEAGHDLQRLTPCAEAATSQ
jgi:ribonuclease BN (tRNA processing enzyme)